MTTTQRQTQTPSSSSNTNNTGGAGDTAAAAAHSTDSSSSEANKADSTQAAASLVSSLLHQLCYADAPPGTIHNNNNNNNNNTSKENDDVSTHPSSSSVTTNSNTTDHMTQGPVQCLAHTDLVKLCELSLQSTSTSTGYANSVQDGATNLAGVVLCGSEYARLYHSNGNCNGGNTKLASSQRKGKGIPLSPKTKSYKAKAKANLAIPAPRRSRPRLPPDPHMLTNLAPTGIVNHTAPIVDIIAVPVPLMTSSSSSSPSPEIPRHYHRIEDNNNNVSSTNLAIYIRREHNWDRAHTRPVVTSLTVILPDRGEFVPPGYCVVRRASGANLAPVPANLATGGERVYLCFRRGREGNVITGIQFITPPANIAPGYTVIERTPFNYIASIGRCWVCIRQRLANLELLRPRPLSNNKNSYYSTGGSVVKTANLGTCHVMDRSTHHLLSPAGLGERLDEASLTTRSMGSSLPSEDHDTNHNNNGYQGYISASASASYSVSTMADSDVDVDTIISNNDDDVWGHLPVCLVFFYSYKLTNKLT